MIRVVHARRIIIAVLLVVGDVIPLPKVFEWARFLFKVGCSIRDYIKRSVVNGSAEITYNSFRSLEAVEEDKGKNDQTYD